MGEGAHPGATSDFRALLLLTARTNINPVDFALLPLPGDTIEIVADAKFRRNP